MRSLAGIVAVGKKATCAAAANKADEVSAIAKGSTSVTDDATRISDDVARITDDAAENVDEAARALDDVGDITGESPSSHGEISGRKKQPKRQPDQKKGTPRNNQAQNRQFRVATRGLTKEQKRQIHDEISGMDLSYDEIKAIADELRTKYGRKMGQMGIKSIVNNLSTRTVWAVKKGVGSFVTIDVGRKHLDTAPKGDVRHISDLRLWIYLCDWQLLRGGVLVLASNSADSDFAIALNGLVGTELDLIEVDSASGGVLLQFTEGYQLILRNNPVEYEPEDDMLLIYPYGGDPIGYRSDLGFYRDSDLECPTCSSP